MKPAQTATFLEELARTLDLGGSKAAADFRALAAYLRETAANDISDAIPEADAEEFSKIYLLALKAAGTNRQLFDAAYSTLKADKTLTADSIIKLARSYAENPTLKSKPKALKAVQDRFETLVQRERKQREIGRLTE